MSDLKPNIVHSLKAGDLGAFRQIYELYRHKVFSLAMKYSLSKEDAEEILQDVFVKVWNAKEKIDLNKNFDNYIFTVCKNCILDKIKRIDTEKKNQEGLISMQTSSQHHVTENEVYYAELLEKLQSILEELPPKRRKVFELNRLHGFTYLQIVEQLNISSSTVEKQMSKALAVVKNKLINYYKA